MICAPGLCIKCGGPIVEGGNPSHRYEHVTLRIKLDDGGFTDMETAICSDCELTSDDFPEVLNAHNEYFKMHGPMRLTGEVVQIVDRKNRAQIQLMIQGGRCLGCHREIRGKWIMTGGVMMHEKCNLPRPGNVMKRAVAPEKVIIKE